MNLPPEYSWLASERFPQVLVEAVKLYGIKEVPGPADNPVILEWAKEVNAAIGKWYVDDSSAWCALFVSVCLKRAGYNPLPGFDALRARSYEKWGQQVTIPLLGDILIFSREGGGHVGLYVGEDKECYHVLGGNQSDMVRVSRIQKNRMTACRRCPTVGQLPKSVRRIGLHPSGEVSKNEA